jgi:hypothetical protein
LLFFDYATGERRGFGRERLRGAPERGYSGDYDEGLVYIEPASIEFEERLDTPPTQEMCLELDTLRGDRLEVGVQERVGCLVRR